MARRAVQAVVEASGADYEIRKAGDRKIRAGTVVYACGPWLPKLFPEILRDRIRPTRQEVFSSARRRIPGDASMDRLSRRGLFDPAARRTRIQNRSSMLTDPPSIRKQATAKSRRPRFAKPEPFCANDSPPLPGAPLVESRVCQYENTSNGDFLIDRHPDQVRMSGWSAEDPVTDSSTGPCVGEYVASQIAGTAPAEPRFSLASKKTVASAQRVLKLEAGINHREYSAGSNRCGRASLHGREARCRYLSLRPSVYTPIRPGRRFVPRYFPRRRRKYDPERCRRRSEMRIEPSGQHAPDNRRERAFAESCLD